MTDGLFTGLRIRDLGIVASTWLRFAMRSGGGVISLFIIVVIGLFITGMVIAQAESIIADLPGMRSENVGASEEERAENIDHSVAWVFRFVLDEVPNKEAEIAFLTEERPAVFSGVLLILLYLIPFAACSAAFNQTAADIGSRGLRFLLSRTERPNIFFGRFISAVFFLAIALGFLVGVIVLYLGLRFRFYGIGDLCLAGLEGWWTLFIFALPFVGLCSWISSTQRSPFAALALCYAGAIMPWLILKAVVNGLAGANVDWDWARLLTPWDWRYGLLSEAGSERMQCHGAMIGFTAFFLLLGLVNFKKRDL